MVTRTNPRATPAPAVIVNSAVTVSSACDFDAQRQMEQAECFLTTIMDERAAQDALALDVCATTVIADAVSSGATAHTEPTTTDDDDTREAHCDNGDDDGHELPVSPVDSPSSGSSSNDASPRAHTPLTLALLEGDDRPVQWDLISPWSESEQDDRDDDHDDDSDVPRAAFFGHDSCGSALYTISEPEPESASCDDDDDDAGARQIEARLRALIKSESDVLMRESDDDDNDVGARTWPLNTCDPDDDDEEFEVFNAMTRTIAGGAATAVGDDRELVDEPLESSVSDAADNDNDENDNDAADCTRTSVATTLDDSCDESPRASSAAAAAASSSRVFGRRAQTYSGAASASVQSAFAKLRSRTLSTTTSSFRQSSQCSSTTTSEIDDLSGSTIGADGSEYESDRNGSFYSDAARSSSVSSRPTLVARLGSVGSMRMSGKMGSFLRFRSSSATTTTSEESYCADTGMSGDTQSAPSLSAIDTTSMQQQQQRHMQMQALKLKASAAASKAAVYLNAASNEAARKLKSRAMRKPPASSSSSSGDECDLERMSGVASGGA